MLHQAYEQMILNASLDAGFRRRLLADPRRTALDAGLSPLLAESLAGLQAGTLSDFAALLHRRIYGAWPSGALRARPVVDQAPPTVGTGA